MLACWQSILTDELTAMLASNMSRKPAGRSPGCGNAAYFLPANQPSTTVMRFSVSVPVCSSGMLHTSKSPLSDLRCSVVYHGLH